MAKEKIHGVLPPGEIVICHECEGWGKIQSEGFPNAATWKWETCSTCGGEGRLLKKSSWHKLDFKFIDSNEAD